MLDIIKNKQDHPTMNEKDLESLTHPTLTGLLDNPLIRGFSSKVALLAQNPKVQDAVQKMIDTPNVKTFYIYVGLTFFTLMGIRLFISFKLKSLPLKIILAVLMVPAFPAISYFIARAFFGAPFIYLADQFKTLI